MCNNLEEFRHRKLALFDFNPHFQDIAAASSIRIMTCDTLQSFKPVYLTVGNEGASLKVWHQGDGPLLVLIQGGGGNGDAFNEAIPNLSRNYKVATYDRRGNGQSTVINPRMLNPMESARDVTTIIKALGYTKASLFGTSSGGLIALQLAMSYPKYVESIVLHETPITSIMPNESIARMDSGYAVFESYMEKGAAAALEQFRASIRETPAEPPHSDAAKDQQVAPHRLDYFFRYEFLIFITYTPNLSQVRASRIPIATVEGVESKGVFHATSAQIQSKILKCRHVVWPGAHAVFVTNPEVFAEELHKTIQILQHQHEG